MTLRGAVWVAALAALATCHRDAAKGKETIAKHDGGIQRSNDDEIQKLVAPLNDEPNPLHGDFTPSVLRLGGMGLPAATAVLPLLDAEDEMTRLHAQRVLEQVVMLRLGWVSNRGYSDPVASQEKVRIILEANGGYDYRAEPGARRRSIALWRQWLVDRGKHDDEIRKLVATLNDEPDMLHNDVTPSVLRLAEMGLPAAMAVLPSLDADDLMTRARAENVLAGVVDRRLGWLPNRGFVDPFAGQEKMRIIWEANGSYDVQAPREKRRRSIALWRQWLRNQGQ